MTDLPGWTPDPDATPYWVDEHWGIVPHVGGAANRMIRNEDDGSGMPSYHGVQVGRVLEVEHVEGNRYRVLIHPYLGVPELPPPSPIDVDLVREVGRNARY